MDLKQTIALVIVIAMVFSSIYNNQNPKPDAGTDTTAPPVEGTPIAFEAKGIDANLIELLPALRLAAHTTQVSITENDQVVSSMGGVEKVNSHFQQDASGLLYIADVSLAADSNAESIIQDIQAQPEFSDVTYVHYALLQMPLDINLTTVNKDLNLTRSYSFADRAIDGLVSPTSLPNDQLRVDLQLTLAGDTLQDKVIFETANLSSSPEYGMTPADAPVFLTIQSLESHLYASFELSSLKSKDTETARTRLAVLPDVNFVSLQTDPDAPQVELAVDSNALSADALRDINAFVHFRSTREPDIRLTPVFSALITLEPSADFAKLQTDWQNLLSTHHLFEKGAFRPQSASGRLDLTLKPEIQSTGILAAQALAVLNEDLNGYQFEFRQPAVMKINDFNINNRMVPLAPSALPVIAFVQPGKTVGTAVPLSIRYTMERGQITQLQAIEK